jgi:membrane protein implicated in regulation of membrane protease activity
VVLLVAIFVAYFLVPAPWGWVLVGVAAAYEVGSGWYSWHWSRSRRKVVGPAALVGAGGVVTEACRPDGWIKVRGELWRARCPEGAEKGAAVRIRAVDGLTLVVEPESD